MATISKLNNVLCVNISKIDNLLKSNVKYFDDNTFCPQTTQTPTPTSTPPSVTPTSTPPSLTPTPTPTPLCETDCCQIQLVYSTVDCTDACDPLARPVRHYITKCISDGCRVSNAIEIYIDNSSGKCEVIAPDGYYSDGLDCGYWNSTTLRFTFNGPC
jgi:hypothetical protein